MSCEQEHGAQQPKLVYFVTEDWYFCSHRLELAVAAKKAGYSVYVITKVNSHGTEITTAGLNLVPVNLSRRSKNLLVEAMFIIRLINIYRRIRPDIVHHIALKPVIYGSIAARLTRVPAVVNAMAGLGFVFSSTRASARLLRPVIKRVFGMLFNDHRSTLILQNPDDVAVICEDEAVSRDRIRLILGSGVSTDRYRSEPETDGVPIVLLASRLLWEKGVGEFVEAASIIRESGRTVRFVLAGDSDYENPESISRSQLEEWTKRGVVEWWGHCPDMPRVFAKSQIVCLPTVYGEGVPKVLIEAASCGRPIVATNVPGCREIVLDGETGFLVPRKDVSALVGAICSLLDSPETRVRMGFAGRQLVKDRFSLDIVIDQTLAVYRCSLK